MKKLELGNILIHDVQFSNEGSKVENGVLYVNKEEICKIALEDENIASCEVFLARPGESVRITPVKDVIEPRVKVEGPGGIFPGWIAKVDTVGEGKTNVLKGAAVVTTGKIVPSDDDGAARVAECLQSIPRDLTDLLKLARSIWPERIVVLPEAMDSAKSYDGNLAEEWDIVRSTATALYGLLFEDDGCEGQVADEFQRRTGYELTFSESSATRARADLMKMRERSYGGRTVDISAHIKGRSQKNTTFFGVGSVGFCLCPAFCGCPGRGCCDFRFGNCSRLCVPGFGDGLAGAGGHHSRSTEHDHLPLHMGCRWLQGSNCGRRHW